MILSKASKLALYSLTEMALSPESLVSAGAIAERFDVSENHVAKVLQQLARSRLVESVRGAGGGYQLARAANDITVADVVTSIEGPMEEDACAECPFNTGSTGAGGTSTCAAEPATCNVHGLLSELTSQVSYTLQSVTIATLARNKSARRLRVVKEMP